MKRIRYQGYSVQEKMESYAGWSLFPLSFHVSLERQRLKKYAQSGKLEADSKCFRISSNKAILGVMGSFKYGIRFVLNTEGLGKLGCRVKHKTM